MRDVDENKLYLRCLKEILETKISDALTGYQKQALDAIVELLSYCSYERLCQLAKADRDGPENQKYISKESVLEAFDKADPDVMADYGECYGSEFGFSRDLVRKILAEIPAANVVLRNADNSRDSVAHKKEKTSVERYTDYRADPTLTFLQP